MSVTPSEVDLSELDSILGPVLAMASRDSSAESRSLALLAKGFNPEVQLPSEAIRLWVISRCVDGYMFGSGSGAIGGRHAPNEQRGHSRSRRTRDIAYEMRSLAKSQGWGQLVDSARARAFSSSGDGRDSRGVAFDIARRVVAGVMMQLPGEPVLLKSNVGARAALALIGLKMLSDEEVLDSAIASYAWVAAELGVKWRAPSTWLKLLESRRVVTRPRGAAFVPSRYRVRALTKRQVKLASQWDGVARALTDGEAGPIARVLSSVKHPAWTYSDKLGLTHWAMLLADTADIDPMRFGIRPRMAKRLRRELTAPYGLVPSVVVPFLTEILDRLADDIDYGTTNKLTGERITARVAKEQAMALYRERAAENKAAAEAATQRKEIGYATLDALLEAHPIPKTPFSSRLSQANKEGREQDSLAWVSAVHRLILSEAPNETARKVVGELLTKRLVKDGYPSGFAEGIVSYVMHAENDVTLEEWMSQASADDGPSTPSRRRG